MHTREKDVFFLNTLNVSLAHRALHVTLVRNQHIDELNELNTCELESQDATKITSASADTHINLLDDDVTVGENIVFVLGSFDNFSVFHLFLPAL